MKNKIHYYTSILFFLTCLFSCSDEIMIQDEVTVDVCDNTFDVRFNKWCVDDRFLTYHIGYPDTLCFDSMIISFPLINDRVNIYAIHPYASDVGFHTYFQQTDQYRIEDLSFGFCSDTTSYYLFADRLDLESPESVNVQFIYYEEGVSGPVDSIEVEFKPWK